MSQNLHLANACIFWLQYAVLFYQNDVSTFYEISTFEVQILSSFLVVFFDKIHEILSKIYM